MMRMIVSRSADDGTMAGFGTGQTGVCPNVGGGAGTRRLLKSLGWRCREVVSQEERGTPARVWLVGVKQAWEPSWSM